MVTLVTTFYIPFSLFFKICSNLTLLWYFKSSWKTFKAKFWCKKISWNPCIFFIICISLNFFEDSLKWVDFKNIIPNKLNSTFCGLSKMSSSMLVCELTLGCVKKSFLLCLFHRLAIALFTKPERPWNELLNWWMTPRNGVLGLYMETLTGNLFLFCIFIRLFRSSFHYLKWIKGNLIFPSAYGLIRVNIGFDLSNTASKNRGNLSRATNGIFLESLKTGFKTICTGI